MTYQADIDQEVAAASYNSQMNERRGIVSRYWSVPAIIKTASYEERRYSRPNGKILTTLTGGRRMATMIRIISDPFMMLVVSWRWYETSCVEWIEAERWIHTRPKKSSSFIYAVPRMTHAESTPQLAATMTSSERRKSPT